MFYLVRGGLIKWQTRMTSVESRVALLHQILFKMKFIFSVALGYRWTTRTMKVTKSKAKLFLSTRDHQSIPLDLVVAHRRINWPIHRNVNTGRDSISAIKSSSLPLVTSTAVSAFGMFTLVIISTTFCLFNFKKCYHISSCGVKRAQVARADGSHAGCS